MSNPYGRRHRLQLFEGTYLFGQFLAIANHVVGRHFGIESVLLLLLARDETVHAVERHPPVVADDPAPTVRRRAIRSGDGRPGTV
jgi:hypothetical protein